MFDPTTGPRIFGEPCGVDFAKGVVDGLMARAQGMPPEDLARVEIYVNSARMQRRIRAMFDAGPALLLPRIRLITDLAKDPVSRDIPPAVAPLQRRLQLSQLVARLLEQEPDLAPRTALYDLSDSLAALMDEMQGEGVSPDAIAALDVSDQSGHWARAQRFLNIIGQFFDTTSEPDTEARQRRVIETLTTRWADAPPNHPVIVAGSTGSRGATALFMQAVAKLPQGAIILPGYDSDLPDAVWSAMDDGMTHEDHPQFRFKHLMDVIGFGPGDVARWSDLAPHRPARNRLISLSLRPAPVTSQWLQEGPDLGYLIAATDGLTLVEAASPRAEAETIALRLRQAVEEGITAALISPDRMLTRQVTAALDLWGIRPDDSAGLPLQLSPPGRMLRHVADLFGVQLTGEALLTLLKHPLCHSDHPDRGNHLRLTHDLELHLRRHGPPFPTGQTLLDWAKKRDGRDLWAQWLAGLISGLELHGDMHLSDHLDGHLALTEAFCAGVAKPGAGGLWAEAAGREARRICDDLRHHAGAGGVMSPRDYAALFGKILSAGVVRDRDSGHPQVLIFGPREAREQGADLTILGGMNDGVWPEAPPPDPWLNRMMRAQAGLLLPERRVGLSAHDYQQAIAGGDVWITRAKRSSDAETIPSRWINRLVNLLGGLPDQGGKVALDQMRARGDVWLAMAAKLAAPVDETKKATHPSPCPPIAARPDQFSVTQIKTLIRDPYAIYARKVLRLDPLDPLTPSADAPLRGNIIHDILEDFIKLNHAPDDLDALLRLAAQHFTEKCPWPTICAQWMARFALAAEAFVAAEVDRHARSDTRLVEEKGALLIAPVGVTLTCKADRIDLTHEGTAVLYDYKTGTLPSKPQQEKFDKQLLLEVAMVERGGFPKVGPVQVEDALFVSIKPDARIVPAPMKDSPTDVTLAELTALFAHWQQPGSGYTARYALFSKNDTGSYDHLSRFGEWDSSDAPDPQVLT
ncbi:MULTISPECIES: PD-(D/E)XK nuclease family protein [unclassified Yoonia]|uniref:PD-(D/E)XK nuclease family protein n=1 Tax=unclassified Yoonia TaxID=2629118 RepID=UPI002AFDFE21|nr:MULTISPECIES: PD-(D/E)XK nuclease family protein [unclassified Yoonia]